MSEFQNPEQQRQAELAELLTMFNQADQELTAILESPDSSEREHARDQKQSEIDKIKLRLFQIRTVKENLEALSQHIDAHAEEFEEFAEMGIPVEEYGVAFDAFQADEIPEVYIDFVSQSLADESEGIE